MWRRTDPARFRGGVAVSTDGGRHWTLSNHGMEESAITHVLLDPRSPKGSRTLYAAAFGRGVYKSTDNGRTWALRNTGLASDPRSQPFAWRLTLGREGTLYLVVARRSERGRDRGPGRRGPLPLDGRRRDLAADGPARGHERTERPHRGPRGSEAALPLGLGCDRPGPRHGWRHLPEHRRRRDVASRVHGGAARLRRHRRSPRPEGAVRLRLRPGGASVRSTAARPGRGSAASTSSGASE